jgi:MoxR-like ATPase
VAKGAAVRLELSDCGRSYDALQQAVRMGCWFQKQRKAERSMNRPDTNRNQELEKDDIQAMEKLSAAYSLIRGELGKIIVGQQEVVEQLMIAIFAQGHVLLEGVPGLAKTLMVSTLARTLNLSFNRIQFTPDLMPSDIVGTEVIQEDKASGTRQFRFLKGPIFANIILAD